MTKIQLKAYSDYDLRSEIIKSGLEKVSIEFSPFLKKIHDDE